MVKDAIYKARKIDSLAEQIRSELVPGHGTGCGCQYCQAVSLIRRTTTFIERCVTEQRELDAVMRKEQKERMARASKLQDFASKLADAQVTLPVEMKGAVDEALKNGTDLT